MSTGAPIIARWQSAIAVPDLQFWNLWFRFGIRGFVTFVLWKKILNNTLDFIQLDVLFEWDVAAPICVFGTHIWGLCNLCWTAVCSLPHCPLWCCNHTNGGYTIFLRSVVIYSLFFLVFFGVWQGCQGQYQFCLIEILLSWLTKFCFTWCVWMLISSLLQNRWPLHIRLWCSFSHTSFSQSLCLNNTTPVLSCLWWDLCWRWWLTSLIQSIVVTTKLHHYNWRLRGGPCTQQKIWAQGVTKSLMKRVNSRGKM